MSEIVKLTIDGRTVDAPRGQKLLWAALDQGIYIPHLCSVKGEERPNAGCRLCFVEIEGYRNPVTACTKTVEAGMVVITRSERVDRLVKTAFELLLSDHNLNCRQCPANHNCALQTIAKERKLKLRQKRFSPIPRDYSIDDSPAEFAFDRSRCVLCGQCVRADRERDGAGVLGFTNRGINRMVSTFKDRPLAASNHNACKASVEACPVGALYFKAEAKG